MDLGVAVVQPDRLAGRGSMTMISGLRSLPRGAARQSETIFWLMPVASSISSRTEKPAVRSTNFATPGFSAMIGRV